MHKTFLNIPDHKFGIMNIFYYHCHLYDH